MKVIQIPFCFYPESVGGTEIYVESLSKQLQEFGVQVLVAAPGKRNEAYTYGGLRVRRFEVGPATEIRELYGEGDERASREFGQILEEEHPDLVHLHAFTRGVSLRIVQDAKRRKIPVIFSYHTPTVTCQRGTLMRWDREVCDGKLRLHTCARCTLNGLGLNPAAAYLAGSLPPLVGNLVGRTGFKGGPWTALRMTELIELRHRSVRALMSEVNHVVALAEWVKDLLVRNGVSSKKVTVSRQGLSGDGALSSSQELRIADSEKAGLKMAFIGRMHPTKGLHLLIQAMRRLPRLQITLDVYAVIQEGERFYEKEVWALAEGDQRIRFHNPVSNSQVVTLLRRFDVLGVPSQCLETGPRVVLEAFAAGIPVIGSKLGGIAELVEDGKNGLLVEHNSLESWRRSLERISEDRSLLARLRSNLRPPRKMDTVTREMLEIYKKLGHP